MLYRLINKCIRVGIKRGWRINRCPYLIPQRGEPAAQNDRGSRAPRQVCLQIPLRKQPQAVLISIDMQIIVHSIGDCRIRTVSKICSETPVSLRRFAAGEGSYSRFDIGDYPFLGYQVNAVKIEPFIKAEKTGRKNIVGRIVIDDPSQLGSATKFHPGSRQSPRQKGSN